MDRRKLLGCAVGAFAAIACALPAMAQDWNPRRPIDLIIPFPPGGGTSTFGQALATPLAEILGVPVNVVNRPGAGGVNGAAEAAGADANGQTLLVTTGGALVMASIFRDIPIDPFADLTPVAQVGGLQASIVVPANSPHETLADLVAAMEADPGSLRWAHTARGAFLHVSGQAFLNANGVEATDVPFQGGANVRAAAVGGQVDFAIIGVHMNRGFENEMRALGVIAPESDVIQPGIPTVAEQGLPYEYVNTPITMFVPDGTPENVIATISAAVEQVVSSNDYVTTMAERGLVASYADADAALQRLRDLEAAVTPVIEAIQ